MANDLVPVQPAIEDDPVEIERLIEIRDDANADVNERRKIAKEDGFDTNILAAILKRRKAGEGQTIRADQMLRAYEEAIAEQRSLFPSEYRPSSPSTAGGDE